MAFQATGRVQAVVPGILDVILLEIELAGATAPDSVLGSGFTVSRLDTGDYRITLINSTRYAHIVPNLIAEVDSDTQVNILALAPTDSAGGQVDFTVRTAGSQADTDGIKVHGALWCCRTALPTIV